MPLHLKNIDLAHFIRSYGEGKRESLDPEKIKLSVSVENAEGQVEADPEQLQRIFDNLLENSRKYAGVEPLMLQIALQKTGENFQICFRDNGQGVPEEKLPFLFDEFYRADEARSQKEGNGLGLYIVKNLVEAMKGRVWAENQAGLAIYMELPKGE